MQRSRRNGPKSLGAAEQAVMDYVWSHPKVTADQCREALRGTWPMKESTMRTVLRRLETKGYVSHAVDGRTYIYSAAEAPMAVATRTVKHLIDRLCGGSAEALVLGMVDDAVISPKQLERLARTISEHKAKKP
jgi:predicted transcriptional regulator